MVYIPSYSLGIVMVPMNKTSKDVSIEMLSHTGCNLRATIAFQSEFGNFRLIFSDLGFVCFFLSCVAVLYLFIFQIKLKTGQFILVRLNKIIT